MKTLQVTELDDLLLNLQQRWGTQVIQQGIPTNAPQARISSGFLALDALLDGGIPSSKVTEIWGKPTSGMTSLTYHIMAEAQSNKRYVVYIDTTSTFDADFAVSCGVQLERLFIARHFEPVPR